MAATVSFNGNAVIGLTLTVTFDAAEWLSGYKITITRNTPGSDGNYPDLVTVRGADTVAITGAVMFFYDHEFPFNETVFYYVQVTTAGGVDVGLVQTYNMLSYATVPTGFALINNVLSPSRRAAGAITQFDTWSREMRVLGNHSIIRRRNPVITDDILGGLTGMFSMTNINLWDINFDGHGPYTPGDVVDSGLETMFDDGGTYQFRSDYNASGIYDFYFTCSSVNTSRLSRVIGFTPIAMKQYDISFVEVDRPLLTHQAGPFMSWADVAEVAEELSDTIVGKWSDLTPDFTSWQNVLEGDLADDI